MNRSLMAAPEIGLNVCPARDPLCLSYRDLTQSNLVGDQTLDQCLASVHRRHFRGGLISYRALPTGPTNDPESEGGGTAELALGRSESALPQSPRQRNVVGTA